MREINFDNTFPHIDVDERLSPKPVNRRLRRQKGY